ncbi:MAG TPA: hypothetical protein VKZ39_01315 [Sphaerochaetaceae bacterium]|nr:hypothetical protein [Sphaerochaetaceae bacterium]
MTGFFIKKAFFDGWDNLISLVTLNLGYLVVLGGVYGALELLPVSFAGGVALAVVSLALHAFYTGMVSVHVKEFAYYSRPGFSEFKAGFMKIWRHALLQLLVNLVLATLTLFIIPFYLSYGSIVTFFIAILMFWVALALAMAMMYFYPLATHMPKDRPLKTLKKSLIIVADNIGFSLFFGFYHLVNLLLTLFFATIIPGASGIMLSRQVAMKLLMFKYDYIEEHPETLKKDIPWEELLFDERENIGHRTLKGMIFPWKE